MTPNPNSPFATGAAPLYVAVDPAGKFVYVANSNGQSVSAYRILGNGGLTPIGSFATGRNPIGIAVDLTGKFVYVTNQTDGTVSAYSVNSKGMLTSIGSPVAAGSLPISVAISP